MAPTPRLELRQGQSLVMTPQLQQAIKLLQLSSVELREYVEDELSENPMLERAEDETGGDDRLAEEHGAEESHDDELEIGDLSPADDPEENGSLTGLEQMNAEEISKESVNSLDMEEYDNIWERDSTPVSEAPGTPAARCSRLQPGSPPPFRTVHMPSSPLQCSSQRCHFPS